MKVPELLKVPRLSRAPQEFSRKPELLKLPKIFSSYCVSRAPELSIVSVPSLSNSEDWTFQAPEISIVPRLLMRPMAGPVILTPAGIVNVVEDATSHAIPIGIVQLLLVGSQLPPLFVQRVESTVPLTV